MREVMTDPGLMMALALLLSLIVSCGAVGYVKGRPKQTSHGIRRQL